MKSRTVNVIIPVYNQARLLRNCLLSIHTARTNIPFVVTVVDDCSTDSDVTSVIREFSDDLKLVSVRNERNRGFTVTANIGLRMHVDCHPLLLNSDTIVYDHWLDGMVEALLSSPQVASVTPMTNQFGSHLSCYPLQTWSRTSTISTDDTSLADIAYRFARGINVEVHTGVGFCLLLNRDCLHQVGLLDEVNFPRGYGEESDLCYRASAMGWRHLVCGGVYVTHLEGRSFGAEKEQLRNRMVSRFRELHPSQPRKDIEFQAQDPVSIIRERLDLGRIAVALEKYCVLNNREQMHSVKKTPALVLNQSPEGLALRWEASGEKYPNLPDYVIPRDVYRLLIDCELIGYQEKDVVLSDVLGIKLDNSKANDFSQNWPRF